MKFGPVPPREAEGATAVHTIRQGALVLKKGTLIGPAEVAALEAAGIERDRGGAARAGRRVGGRGRGRDRRGGGGRGRARRPRLHRPRQSVRRSSRACWWSTRTAIDALNRVDEAITFATLPAFKPVVAGEMIATVKIIPFAVGEAARDAALAAARAASRSFASRPTRSRRSAWSRRCCRASPTRWSTRRCEITAGAARAGRRRASSPSAACRTSRRRSPRRSTRC